MNVSYRDGRSGDGAALSGLFCESFAATFGHLYAREDLAAFLCEKEEAVYERDLADRDYAFRLAEVGDDLAAFVKLGPNDLPINSPSTTVCIQQFYVLGAWHGRGIAPALMDWTINEARRRGATHLQLSVYVDNHRARRFYQKYGFVEVGHYVFMVGNHADDDRILRVQL